MNLERPNVIKQLSPFERLLHQQRLYPSRIAKLYLSGQPLTLLEQLHSESTTNNVPLTDAEKEEKLALGGIMIHWMIDGANKMREQRPPYGLIYLENGLNGDFSADNMKIIKDANLLGDPFTTFSFAIHHTFAHALEEKRKQIFTCPKDTKLQYIENIWNMFIVAAQDRMTHMV